MAVTDHQTAGRGRRGRTWADEPGESLMFSLLLRPTAPTEALAPLALVIGIGLAEALPVTARLRWPNDIVVGGAKVAGILTELETPVEATATSSPASASTRTRRATRCRRPTGSRPRRCWSRPGGRRTGSPCCTT